MGGQLKKLILITYVNRSGSTLLLNLFSKVPQVFSCLEAEVLIEELLKKPLDLVNPTLIETLNKDVKLSAWNLPQIKFTDNLTSETRFDLFIRLLTQSRDIEGVSADVICFKGTKVFENFSSIKHLCNHNGIDCKLVRIVRDPRAIYISQHNTISPTSNKVMCNNPIDLSVHWNYWLEETSKYADVKTIVYENLLKNGYSEFDKLCSNLELPFKITKSFGFIFSRLPEEHKKIHKNIDKEIKPYNKIAWKNSYNSYVLAIIEELSRKNMKKFQYEPINKNVNLPFKLFVVFYFRIQSKIRREFSPIKQRLT